MKMRVDVGDPEAERGDGEKTVCLAEKLTDMKQHLVDACLDPRPLRNRVVKHAVRLEPALGHAYASRLDPPDLHAQALSRPAARHIDGVDGNSACHFINPLFSVAA